MRNEVEIKESLAEMEIMAESARKILHHEKVKENQFLTTKFTEWMHKCDARANILKWVLGLPYLEDYAPVIKYN